MVNGQVGLTGESGSIDTKLMNAVYSVLPSGVILDYEHVIKRVMNLVHSQEGRTTQNRVEQVMVEQIMILMRERGLLNYINSRNKNLTYVCRRSK